MSEARFVQPDLRALDATPVEVIACSAWQDERPFRGALGLLDWRLAGKLSALARSGFLRGDAGEVMLVPGRPKLPFEKVIVLGLGPRGSFDEAVARAAIDRLRLTLEGLKVKRALVEVPGRASGELDAERLAEILIECARDLLEEQAWTLVDTDDAETSLTQRLQRRRDARPRPGA